MEELILRSGPGGVAFRRRCDVVLGACQVKKAYAGLHGAGRQLAERPIECKFEVLRVDEVLLEPWGTVERPALEKIYEARSDPNAGHVLPIRSPATDLAATSAGVLFKKSSFASQYVMVVGRALGAPAEQIIGDGDEAVVELVHSAVVSAEQEGDENQFSVEIVCPADEAAAKRMPEGKPHLIVGGVVETGGGFTILAENIFALGDAADAVAKFTAEREACWLLLETGIVRSERKREAITLIENTPSKKKCISA